MFFLTKGCRNRSRQEAGFTLFELLVAVVLLAMVSSMIYSVLGVGIRFSDKGEQRILAMAREHGVLHLLRGQVVSAMYNQKFRQPRISASNETVRIVTRQPFLNRKAGVVMAMYRYNEEDQTLYYLEKLDYYNIDYDDYVPDLADMLPLAQLALQLEYDSEAMTLTVEQDGQSFSFRPKSLSKQNNIILSMRDS